MDGLLPRLGRLGVLLLLALVLGLSGCSPEGARTRGGGAGADSGNREGDVELTGDRDRVEAIYHGSRDQLPPTEGGTDG